MKNPDLFHDSVLTNGRFAGGVKRYHTWPTSQSQDVSQHTWQQMRIYYALFGAMSPTVSTALLFSDAGELLTGDAPFYAKRRSPPLKMVLDPLEVEGVILQGGPDLPDCVLTQQEKHRIKACDLIEMFEFGLIEMAFGSAFGQPICRVTYIAIGKLIAMMREPEDIDKITYHMAKLRRAAREYGIDLMFLNEVQEHRNMTEPPTAKEVSATEPVGVA